MTAETGIRPRVISADFPGVEFAACRGLDVRLFFTEQGESQDAAKAVCAGCPVRGACLTYAIANWENWGIWGGLSPRERRRVRTARAVRGAA